MTDTRQKGASPQVNVRFRPDELERLRDRAAEDFGGNVSVLVKVAVKRLLDADNATEDDAATEAESLEARVA